MSGTIVTLTGPTCSGKTTLEGLLVQEGFKRIISHTTRPKRAGEVNGEAYFFLTVEEFKEKQAAGEFVESIEHSGNLYAASKQQFTDLLDAGHDIVIVVEPNGRDEIIQYAESIGAPVMPVFITNPANVLARRFIERTISDFTLKLASGNADKSIAESSARLDMILTDEIHWRNCDHPAAITFGLFNKDNQRAVVTKIMNRAEAVARAVRDA